MLLQKRAHKNGLKTWAKLGANVKINGYSTVKSRSLTLRTTYYPLKAFTL